MNGAAATIATGNTIAAASSPVAAWRVTETSGEESSTTGSKVMAHIAQSETISTLNSTAASAGRTSGATNAIKAKRRAVSWGQRASAMAAMLGHVMTIAITTVGAI